MGANTLSGDLEERTATGLSNTWLAVLFFIAVEIVLFASMISAFVYLRTLGAGWPPPGMPRLDPVLPAVNMIVLLASGGLAYLAERQVRRYRIVQAERLMLLAGLLGLVFLLGQLNEYGNLLSRGVAISTGIYGSLFYTLIGFHGFHVLSGVIWLLAAWYLTRQARQTPDRHTAVRSATLYWEFVAIVWIAIYLLLYIV